MGFGIDLNSIKLEAAKAAEAEKTAIMRYIQRYNDAQYGELNPIEKVKACDDIISEAAHDPVISAQSFVALCVWAWA